MASSNVTFTTNTKSIQQILDDQTIVDKLTKCTIDLRHERIDPCEDLTTIPELFVITLFHQNKTYDA